MSVHCGGPGAAPQDRSFLAPLSAPRLFFPPVGSTPLQLHFRSFVLSPPLLPHLCRDRINPAGQKMKKIASSAARPRKKQHTKSLNRKIGNIRKSRYSPAPHSAAAKSTVRRKKARAHRPLPEYSAYKPAVLAGHSVTALRNVERTHCERRPLVNNVARCTRPSPVCWLLSGVVILIAIVLPNRSDHLFAVGQGIEP